MDPDILILDDSSSALDYATDARLRMAIRQNFTEKSETTSVIVAQRISSILHSDLILVLEDGRVTGRGTHEELLASCPVYPARQLRIEGGAEAPAVRDEARRKPNEQQSEAGGAGSATIAN